MDSSAHLSHGGGRHQASGRSLRTAFTLIELLVVVAIIAILLSILLPSLERARAQARQLLGLTNQRTQGQAAYNYSSDNDGWIPRGIQSIGPNYEYQIYVTAILPYLGYDGDPFVLWRGSRPGQRPNHIQQKTLRKVLLSPVGQTLQCPDFPEEEPRLSGANARRADHQYLDYVASAMPIPYPEGQIEFDVNGGGQAGDEFAPSVNTPYYEGTRKLDELAGIVQPAQTIYVTEAHKSLYWDDYTFHHFFLTSQLPFGSRPRIASDQRHPGGINALFFDGHAKTLRLKTVDPGWPNSLGLRLGLFTRVPPEYY